MPDTPHSSVAAARSLSSATVTAAWGRRVEIELADGSRHPARLRGRNIRAVCGDRVQAARIRAEAEWLVEAVSERDSELARMDSRGQREILAANVDMLLVVVAPQPTPDLFIVDRFLGAARLLPCEAAVVVNKSDICAQAPAELATYRALGVTVLSTSATNSRGVTRLRKVIGTATGVLVGQSGAGKSSLTNALVPEADLRTGELMVSGKEGRHTTVASILLRLSGGGALIDSPGVRDFAPYIDNDADVAYAYAEIAAAAPRCRFGNCRHMGEPDCAVTAAVATGDIEKRRYRSYRRLLNLSRKLAQNKH